MKSVSKKRLTSSQLDELLATVRRESALQQYKRTGEERQMMEAWRAAEKARNYQIQYGQLAEAHSRLPIALQDTAFQRMRALGDRMEALRAKYPRNFPRGPGLKAQDVLAERRLVV